MTNKNIVALDLSTTSTGIAIYKNGALIYSNALKPDPKLTLDDRIAKMIFMIKKEIYNCKIIDEFNGFCFVLVLEEPTSGAKNIKTIGALYQLIGALIFGFKYDSGWDIDVVKVSPNEWREKIIGLFNKVENEKGNFVNQRKERAQLKKEAIAKVKELFNKEVETDDEAEAILIGKWFLSEEKYNG